MRVHTSWVRAAEHWVLRLVSFVFAVASAHAIEWFFSALNGTDNLQPWATWFIAAAFGLFGYFVSRGLALRLMNKERAVAYLFIGFVFEFVEVTCNYAMAAASASSIDWLHRVHGWQHDLLSVLVYIVLSIIPVLTILFAWVDMDLERAKQGYTVQAFGARNVAPAPMPLPVVPRTARPAVAPTVPGPVPGLSPLVNYPPMPPLVAPAAPAGQPGPGVFNALGNYWNNVRAGLQPHPAQAAPMVGSNGQPPQGP